MSDFYTFWAQTSWPLMAMTVNVLVFGVSKATKTQNDLVAWLNEEISLNSFLKSLFYNSVGYFKPAHFFHCTLLLYFCSRSMAANR